MAGGRHAAPRRAAGVGGHAAIRRRTIEIIFQRYPGTDADSAVRGLEYRVTIGGAERRGTTGDDGKVTIRVAPGVTAHLHVMGTEYRLTSRGTLEAVSHLRGVQRRLNMLGYNAGQVDGVMGKHTEYAVLGFQADNDPLSVDGLPGRNTQRKLEEKVGE